MFSVLIIEEVAVGQDVSKLPCLFARDDLHAIMHDAGITAPIVSIHFADEGRVTASGIKEMAEQYAGAAVLAIAHGSQSDDEEIQDEALDRAEFLLTDSGFALVTKELGGYEFKSTLLFLNDIGQKVYQYLGDRERKLVQ